jgi:Arc/MetJ-type ribon-helix-helix transcriptional regulator
VGISVSLPFEYLKDIEELETMKHFKTRSEVIQYLIRLGFNKHHDLERARAAELLKVNTTTSTTSGPGE